MSNSTVPFHTQAALLERYAKSQQPAFPPEVIDFIVDLLRSDEALTRHFFRSRPSAGWAPILWERGFFSKPPEPILMDGGYALPVWHEQEYLISVADQQPELIIQHVNTFDGHGRYLSKAVQGLCLIPVEQATTVISRVCGWLRDERTANELASVAFDLAMRLAEQHETDSALALFRELLAPLPSHGAKRFGTMAIRGDAIAKFRQIWHSGEVLTHGLEALRSLAPEETVSILEDSLLSAVRLEAHARESERYEFSSWWRSKIEEHTHDDHAHRHEAPYKDLLVDALRDTLEWLAIANHSLAQPILHRYLNEQRTILKRICLHVLHRHPEQFPDLVAAALMQFDQLEESETHHEQFLLLRKGFPQLAHDDQEHLVATILQGPSSERLDDWTRNAQDLTPGLAANEFIELQRKLWVRDRLWMIGHNLDPQARSVLDELVVQVGQPEDPSMTHGFRTSSYWVEAISPLSEDDILQKPCIELVSYLKEWTPPPDQPWGPKELTFGGLGDAVASVIVRHPERYEECLFDIAACRPAYAYRIVNRFREDTQAGSRPWKLLVGLCEQLIAYTSNRDDTAFGYDESWRDVRKSIIHLLHYGLANEDDPIPAELLEGVRGLILRLMDDPDPDLAADRPPEGSFGHKDPVHVAINHIRSMALEALIAYAWRRRVLSYRNTANTLNKSIGSTLEPKVRDMLTKRLDRSIEPTLAVHCVFGRYLKSLYRLDPGWTIAHINDIFPTDDDEGSRWMFAAAFDAFVGHNEAPTDLFQLLRPKYWWAVDCLQHQFVTKSNASVGQGLAIHLTWHYLVGNYELSQSKETPGLLESYYSLAPADARDGVAWCVWRVAEENPETLQYWPRIRRLWEWRTQVASGAGHPPEFDDEMRWFAKLALAAPLQQETLATLWPLLEALLPHVTRSEYVDIGWDALSELLAREVDRDPRRAIQLYRRLYDQTSRPQSFYSRNHERKIVETAVQHLSSREETCWLIDAIARDGDFERYRDIYDRRCG